MTIRTGIISRLTLPGIACLSFLMAGSLAALASEPDKSHEMGATGPIGHEHTADNAAHIGHEHTGDNADHPSPAQQFEKSKNQEMRLLNRFLNLPPEKLAQIRRTIERIEKMPPEEKEALRQKINEFRGMNPGAQRDIRRDWNNVPPEERKAMQQKWFNMPPERRKAMRRRMMDMRDPQHPQMRRSFDLPQDRPPPDSDPAGQGEAPSTNEQDAVTQ